MMQSLRRSGGSLVMTIPKAFIEQNRFRYGLSLESELQREILSAYKIYWLVSFIKWAGIRIFQKELEA